MSGEGALQFREARFPEDLELFRRVEYETTRASLSAAERERVTDDALREALEETHRLLFSREGNRVYVVELQAGVPAALLWVGANRNLLTGRMEAWIYNVTVLDGHRGRGLGTAILAWAETAAREAGYEVIGLMVAAHNEGAIRLYERLGFEASNLVMRKRLER